MRILVVEDDPIWRDKLCDMYERIFEEDKPSIARAASVSDAKGELKQGNIDLLSTDILLVKGYEGTPPEGDGRTILRKASEWKAAKAVVVITGMEHDADIEVVFPDPKEQRLAKMKLFNFVNECFPGKNLLFPKALDLSPDENIDLLQQTGLTRESLLAMIGNGRTEVFVSYSHKDEEWFKKFKTMFEPLEKAGTISLWYDKKIGIGEKWKVAIEQALARAKVALLLVSEDFLASNFIAESELPPLLNAAEEEGLIIAWVYVNTCVYEATKIKDYQATHDISKSLEDLSVSEQKRVIKSICMKISKAVKSQ